VGVLLGALGVVQLGLWLRRAMSGPGDGVPPA
jgi:hypothetical protein